MYYAVCFDELPRGGSTIRVVDLPKHLYSTKDEIIQKFYDMMTCIFKQYEDSYVPESIDKMEIEDLVLSNVCDIVFHNEDQILEFIPVKHKDKYKYRSTRQCDWKEEYDCQEIWYGVSGGLHLTFGLLIIPVETLSKNTRVRFPTGAKSDSLLFEEYSHIFEDDSHLKNDSKPQGDQNNVS
jgi:hypothetical protein